LFPGDAANFLYGGDPVATRGHSMPIMKLTKRTVDGIQPTGRRFIVYDTELKGFGLKVTPSGSKTWSVEYRGGARGRSVSKRRMVLGPVTTLTPDEARNAARAILARVALGEDPAAARERAREIPSFREFAERYLLEEAEAKLKSKTVVNYRIYLRKHTYAPRPDGRRYEARLLIQSATSGQTSAFVRQNRTPSLLVARHQRRRFNGSDDGYGDQRPSGVRTPNQLSRTC
jgi:hypothetical protein